MLGDSLVRDEHIDQEHGRLCKIKAAAGWGRRLTGTGFGAHFHSDWSIRRDELSERAE